MKTIRPPPPLFSSARAPLLCRPVPDGTLAGAGVGVAGEQGGDEGALDPAPLRRPQQEHSNNQWA